MFLSNGALIPNQIGTLADQSPIFSDASYYSTSYVNLEGAWAAYGQIYRSQLWVGVVVRKLAASTVLIPIDVMVGTDRENGALQDLLDRPNPDMSGAQLKEWTSATWDVYGEAFWLKLRDDTGRVRGLQPMHPRQVIVRRNPDTGELYYTYSAGTRDVSMLPPIPAKDVVAFTSYNPENTTRGVSVLEGLRMTLLNEDASRRATASWWHKGARPSMILTHPGELSTQAQERLKRKFEASHSGADNMGGVTVFEEGISATITQLNAEEMQYIETRKLNREEVCAAFDVPPPVVHILDHATFSNITEQMRSKYRDTMAPRFARWESALQHQLLPDFYDSTEASIRFNMSEVLRGDYEVRVDKAMAARQSGLISGNEGRYIIGEARSEDPEMDKIYANAALVPLGSKPPAGAPGAASTPTDASGLPSLAIGDKPKAVTARSVMGKLSRVKGNRPAIREKLIEAHAKELKGFFGEQKAAVKAAIGSKAPTGFDPKAWDSKLAEILLALSKGTTQAIGDDTAASLSGDYDPDRLEEWLGKEAGISATNINQTTADQLAAKFQAAQESEEEIDPEDTVDDLFDGEVAARGDQISLSRVAMLGGLASLVAAEQNDAATKTWVVTAGNPRPSHSAMDGETVGLNEQFSNGMNGPGDYSGGPDEVAGCTCDLQFSKESK